MTEPGAENMTNEPIDSQNTERQDTTTAENTEVVELSIEEQLKAQVEETNDKYIRLLAEFDNFKRRTAKERIELFKTANAETVKSLITVLVDGVRA